MRVHGNRAPCARRHHYESVRHIPFSDSARLIPLADTVNRSSDAAERTAAITGIAAYAGNGSSAQG